ncbi:type IV secretory system conjugative DNA transfer family protein [Deinococcus ruber]|uniref:Uncharacterized protein n=1 Tax=Deinococcus ruber TaxID=1848197 RepID=A0A918C9V1_9DEIO|nr:type IV secretory system conjugative DNA transfer family protein [Deinococcus ruber]GGR12895.1 hypothetical protein GCM10008957_27310 [Deinococcus ruber]
MTTVQPAALPARPPAQPLNPVTITFVMSLLFGVGLVLLQFMDVGQQAAAMIHKYTGLAQARQLDTNAWAALLVACGNDTKCAPWLSTYLQAGMAGYWFALLLPLVLTPLAAKFFPKPRKIAMKDPGLAHWETKDRMTRFFPGNDTHDDPFVAFMGYLKAGKDGGSFEAKELPPLFIPREDWCQNTLVWGGIRSGKTTAFFQPNIFLAAHLGLCCVVFDVKWPQKDSGFFETIGYWHARGRRVVLLAPFEEYGARVNMLRDVHSFSDALEKADEVFPPPEFQEERGKFHNDKRRFGIAAFIWLLRTEMGDKATMRHVLDYAMMPEDRLMTWVENARDEQAKTLLMGYRDGGASNFAEVKNGIISALKIFFNADVVRATSGSLEEAVDLEECMRQPTLIVIGINAKNNMDGSGEVLFRLYKRMIDRAAMRVADEQGGKLRRHLAIFLDEKSNIGRINYMIRSMSMLRSYNISHHLGIQNEAQNELVDGELYWKAMSTNVIARTIMFPRGITGEDAVKISDTIGKTTATSVSVGGSRSLNPLLVEGSNQASASLTPLHLLSTEEFPDFAMGEAVVKMNGQHPIRTQLVPMGMPYVQGTGIKKNQHRNLLYTMYADTLTRCPGGLIAYTNHVIRGGLLVGSPKKPVPVVPKKPPEEPGSAAGAGPVVPKPLVPSASAAPAPAPGGASVQPALLVAPPVQADTSANLDVQEAYTWVRACMDAFVEVSLLMPEQVVTVRINKQEADAVNGEGAVNRLFVGGLVEPNRTRMDAKFTARANRGLSDELKATLLDYADARPAYEWLKTNATAVEGTLERAAYVEACQQAPEPLTPIKVVAALENGQLLCGRTVTREIFRSSGGLRFPQRRVASRDLDVIPLTRWVDTAAAVRVAREKPQEAAAPKEDSRRGRKRNREALISQIVVPPEGAAAPESPPAP